MAHSLLLYPSVGMVYRKERKNVMMGIQLMKMVVPQSAPTKVHMNVAMVSLSQEKSAMMATR